MLGNLWKSGAQKMSLREYLKDTIKQECFAEEVFSFILSKLSLRNPLLKQNRELKGQGAGKRCFLIATGPSIKQQDLKLLEGEDCFTVSNFFVHEDIKRIKPKLHFFAPYHKPLVEDNFVENWRCADRMLPKKTNIVLGTGSRRMVQEHGLFSERKIYYLNFRNLKRVRGDIEKSVMAPQTGTMMIFPVLAYMGYTEINLIGCDMNMLKDYGKKVENFYAKDIRKNATDEGRWQGILFELEANLIMMKQYKMYKDFLEMRGVKVQNLSPTSWIDFIDKVEYMDAVRGGQKESGME